MPDFTFTSPDGKNYTVSGPEGATKEQAFQVLQSQIAQGTAKEATAAAPQEPIAKPKTVSERAKDAIANINAASPLNHLAADDKPVPAPTIASAAKSIAGSTAFGGIAGALSPEIVTGIGMAASFIPGVGEAVGPALMETGTAMRGMRLAEAGAGAVSGLTSEAAGQAVEAGRGTKAEADAARLVGGMLTPGAGAVAGAVAKPAKLAWNFAQKVIGGEQSIPKAVEVARENLAKLSEAGQPQTAMHAMLQKGVEANRQAADRVADVIMADAHKQAAAIAEAHPATATRLVEEARVRADQIRANATREGNVLDKASDGKLATANRVLAQQAPELAKVGQVRDLSAIGTELREAATAKQGAEIEARNQAYQATVAERDAAVKAKEEAGQTVGDTPAMASLKKELNSKLSGEGGFAKTTDAGIRRVYQQVHDAVNPSDQKLSFEALDQVRRRLGDVIAGNQSPEGYEAIGKQAAQKMYAQISKAQEQFVGDTVVPGGTRNIVKLDEGGSGTTKLKDGTVVRLQHSYHPTQYYAELKAFDKNGKQIGTLQYSDEGAPLEPIVEVNKEHQRKGLATILYDTAEANGAKIPGLASSGATRSRAGQAFREGLERQRTTHTENLQRKLQSEYSEASGDLTRFGSKAGKKLTAVDRIDPEKFAGDAKALPKAFFNSRQSIADAKELTGNPQLVDRQASDYAARSLQGQDAAGVRKWAFENKEWTDTVPGLTKRINDYAKKAEQIERLNKGLANRSKALGKEAEATRAEGAKAAAKERQAGLERASDASAKAQEAQERVIGEGSKAATATREQAFAPAKGLETILKGGEAPEAVRNLLLNGKPEQTRLAAKALANEPGGKQVLEQSVRQSMRNMTEGNLRQQWTERIRPMLSDGKMIPPERLKALDDDVNRLLRAYKGPDKLSLVQRHIAAVIGTVGGQVPNQ